MAFTLRNAPRYPKPQYRWALLLLLAGLGLFVLHAPLRMLEVAGARPDWLSLVALYLALWTNPRGRYLPCLVFGLLRDLMSVGPLGSYAILYALVYRGLERRRASMARAGFVAQFVIALVGTLVVNLGYHVAMAVAGHGVGWRYALVHALLTAIMTAPLMPVLVSLLELLFKKLGVRKLSGNLHNV